MKQGAISQILYSIQELLKSLKHYRIQPTRQQKFFSIVIDKFYDGKYDNIIPDIIKNGEQL